MRLKLKKEDLNKGLQAVQKVAQNKSNNISSENGLLIKASMVSSSSRPMTTIWALRSPFPVSLKKAVKLYCQSLFNGIDPPPAQ